MAKKSGDNLVFKLGTTTVVGVVSFDLPGLTYDKQDTTVPGDDAGSFLLGIGQTDDIPIEGLFDANDTTGQDVLEAANANKTALTDPRFYLDRNSTTYYGPSIVSPVSSVYVLKYSRGPKKGSAIPFSCVLGVSGKLSKFTA